MAISLAKGNKIELSKSVTKFRVGLGWDITNGKEFDLDVMALLLDDKDKAVSGESMVFYGKLKDEAESVLHSGDNRTGAGDGDDEVITVHTDKVPANIHQIVFLLNIHDGVAQNLNFGQVKNARANLYEGDAAEPAYKFDLEEDASNETQVVFCKIYRHNGGWKFAAIDEKKKALLRDTLKSYGFDVKDAPAI